MDPPRLLLITGTIGSGKTAVATEAGRLLAARGLPCAVVDLDWLGWVHVSGFREHDELIAANLAAMWPSYARLGIEHMVLARAVSGPGLQDAIRRLMPRSSLITIRLAVSAATVERRLRARDRGAVLSEHLEQSREMANALDEAALEDFAVENDAAPPEVVAANVLARAGW